MRTHYWKDKIVSWEEKMFLRILLSRHRFCVFNVYCVVQAPERKHLGNTDFECSPIVSSFAYPWNTF